MKPMESEVIYEKKYPHKDYLAQYEIDKAEVAKDPNSEKLTFDEIMERIYGGRTYTPIPERIMASDDFIREAIKISEMYEIDIRITRRIDHISATLSFDCGGGMSRLKRLFGMTDEFSFFKDSHDRDLTICLDFYTHIIKKNGMILAP